MLDGPLRRSLSASLCAIPDLRLRLRPTLRICSDDSTASRITHSGLLNALHAIGAHEGRILFPTTNK